MVVMSFMAFQSHHSNTCLYINDSYTDRLTVIHDYIWNAVSPSPVFTMSTLIAPTQPFRHIKEEDYVCTLTKESEERAQTELNENPKDRLNAVKALREWIEQQPHFSFRTGGQ